METRGSLLGPVPLSPGPPLNCAHGARTPGDLAFSLAALSRGLWLPRTLEERGAGATQACACAAHRGLPWPFVASQPQGPQLLGRRSLS